MRFGIVELYCGKSGKKGFYNSQEIGLARAFKEIGYETYIFYPNNSITSVQEEVIEDRINIVSVPAKCIGNHSKYNWKILLDFKIEVIQIGSDNQIFVPQLVKFCDNNNILLYNYIGTIKSDSDNIFKKSIMDIFFKRNLNIYKSHKCFAKTDSVKDELQKKGIFDITVAPVGLDVTIIPDIVEDKEQIKRKNGVKNKKVILYVGRMDNYKKPFNALEIIDNISDGFVLFMVGTGSLDDEIDEMIHKKKLEKKVYRVKQIPNIEIHEYYKMADYFLNFNNQEIFGMSILEAMYQGTTVIAMHAPGPDMIIENGKSGYLTNSLDEMINLIENEKFVLRENVKERIINKFVWDKTAKKFNTWIKESGAK